MKNALTDAVAAGLARIMNANGFRKKRRVWNRPAGELIQVVEIEADKHNVPCDESLTMSVGIFDPVIYQVVWGKGTPEIVREPNCVLRTRIGPLIEGKVTGGGHDKWWKLRSEADVGRTIEDFEVILLEKVFPFLAKSSSVEAIDNCVSAMRGVPRHVITPLYPIVLKARLNRPDEAKRMFREFIEKMNKRANKSWTELARRAAERLGLQI